MSKTTTFTDRTIRALKDNRLVAFLIVIVAVVVALGQLFGAFSTIASLWKSMTSTDLKVFKYQDQTITFAGGNGTALEMAVVINGALTRDAGLAAEKYWLERFYPDYTVTRQFLLAPNKTKPPYYDLLAIKSKPTGFERQLFFDITSFFGAPGDPARDRQLEKMALEILLQHKKGRE